MNWIVFKSGTKYTYSDTFFVDMGRDASFSRQIDLESNSTSEELEFNYDENEHIVSVKTLSNVIKIYKLP